MTETKKKKGGRPFAKTAYLHILRNPIYIGKILSVDGLVDAKHKGIVEVATFEKVQRLLVKNYARRKSLACNKYNFLLRGLVRCVHCGSIMTSYHAVGRDRRVRYFYYKCTQVVHRGRLTCPVRTVKARTIEQALLTRIHFLGETASVVEQVVGRAQELTAAKVPLLKEELRHLTIEKRKNQEELAQLMKALKAMGAETSRSVAEELNRLDARQFEFENQESHLQGELASERIQSLDPKEVLRALQQFSAVFDSLTPFEQDQLMHLLIQEVRYDGLTKTVDLAFYPPFAALPAADSMGPSINSRMLHH